MASRKPNLFIIGAAKSGTTSLHHYLSQHPEIFLSEPKEPGYFVPELEYYPRDLAWYLGLFDNAGSSRYAGESSTHYTKLPMYPGVPDRIAAFVDEPPRFIYVIRDPLDRAISHYWHNVRKFQEHRPIAKALRDGPEYLPVSDYARQLAPYFERFGRDAVYVIVFEELVRDPRTTVGSILEWLELDSYLPDSFDRLNAMPESMQRVRGRGALDRIARSRLWERLAPLAPRRIKDFGKRLAYRPVGGGPAGEVVERFRPQAQAAARRIEELLGRRSPEWTTTFPVTGDRYSASTLS